MICPYDHTNVLTGPQSLPKHVICLAYLIVRFTSLLEVLMSQVCHNRQGKAAFFRTFTNVQ